MDNRVLAWYSDGAASAVMSKLVVEKYGDRVEVIKCDTTSSEHRDNLRFRRDVENWIGKKIKLISSNKYKDVDAVFEQTRYMSGVAGARCTVELKKVPRFEYQRADDIHVFGLTADEYKRIETFKQNNPELDCDWILHDKFIRKADCYRILKEAGIELPEMYNSDLTTIIASVVSKPRRPDIGTKYENISLKHLIAAQNKAAKLTPDLCASIVNESF